MAAKAIFDKARVTPIKLKMGAGKSYIAAVIAQYYYQKNMKAAIVTSKPILVSQYNRMLGKAR